MKPTSLLLLPLASTALGSVTFYVDKNFQGESKVDIGCVNLDGNFANRISSIKPKEGFACVFYTVLDCNPPSAFSRRVYRAPGEGDLGGYDNTFKSFYCYKDT